MTAAPLPDRLEGHLERITFYNPENHYTIARFLVQGTENAVTIVGHLPNPIPGEMLSIEGAWETHPKFGEQLKIASAEVILPDNEQGIRNYLASGLIRGIGTVLAGRMIRHFGTETLNVIEKNPDRLCDIEGIGWAKAQAIQCAWQEHHAARQLMEFLRQIGVQPAFAAKIIQLYGPDALSVIETDPFCLAADLPRVGFIIADAVARHLDLPVEPTQRAAACLRHLLENHTAEGHVFAFENRLIERCCSQFEITPEDAKAALEQLIDTGDAVRSERLSAESRIYPQRLYEAESGISRRIAAFLSIPPDTLDPNPAHAKETILGRFAISLSEAQQAALESTLSNKIAIITGGPGTGKTTLIRSAVAILEADGRRVVLAAPTGRAARRLGAVTGRPAATLHKLLEYSPSEDRFIRNPDNPLEADAVIVDEASMVDTLLMFHLMRAVPMRARIILSGDVYQLPSVGSGTVLADLIRSKTIPVFSLNEIFRQENESLIVQNAHRIRSGRTPIVEPAETVGAVSDFHFIEEGNPKRAAETVVELCSRLIPHSFQLDAISEIQVLTPMHRGAVGTIHLNQALQRALNPRTDEARLPGVKFRVGDKVMHLRNNYSKDVFNGDIGSILSIDRKNDIISVDYADRIVDYDASETDEISLAYAITVHKSQGSEYPAVVLPLVTQHYPLLQRNLIYTAITRARSLVVVVGTKKSARYRSGQRSAAPAFERSRGTAEFGYPMKWYWIHRQSASGFTGKGLTGFQKSGDQTSESGRGGIGTLKKSIPSSWRVSSSCLVLTPRMFLGSVTP